VPAQIVLEEGEIRTLTGNTGFTVIVIVLDVAGFPVMQVALEVRTQLTVFPFTGAYV
jgi:hypothetical protein